MRAALIALHCVAIMALAFPAPSGGMSRKTWADPTVQAELEGWRERLGGVGLALDKDAFQDGLFDLASGYMKVRAAILAPMRPYHLYFGTWQSWRMFIAPHMYPSRLHVDVHDADGWREVYAARSDEATWLRPLFDHDRMRAAVFRYAWPNFTGTYRAFCAFLARRAAVDFPEADQIRVRFRKGRTPTPEEVRAGVEVPSTWSNARILDLAPLRAADGEGA
ncbi:MAG: hypothetical protein H6733_02025 [Alphaproteobacteria bacterium]|nr:hypothetical protein [Alphaproteobacteria bacterium]